MAEVTWTKPEELKVPMQIPETGSLPSPAEPPHPGTLTVPAQVEEGSMGPPLSETSSPHETRTVLDPAPQRPPPIQETLSPPVIRENSVPPACSGGLEPTDETPSEMRLLWGQMKVLGAMQILIGLTQLVFGVPLSVSMVRTVAGKSGASFWTGIWFIISGAVTVELRRRPTSWNATTLTLTVALLLFTLLEMGLATVSALYCYRCLFQFETTYSILHDVIMRHPSRSE
ncbi:membrane-spanning 4-domains subfamily A member 8-like isoform X3 [Narcine bancroftii]|uniref:membrane-spanning 4-domains subfamily A member 8-like isoform X3 n=1 Tax=Narcine bancroftii TaxID=1343680 RepID=UPI003831DA64